MYVHYQMSMFLTLFFQWTEHFGITYEKYQCMHVLLKLMDICVQRHEFYSFQEHITLDTNTAGYSKADLR